MSATSRALLNALGTAEQHQQQCLLRVHAIFGLIEDDGLRAVEHCVRDFGVAVRGEAVHEDGVGLGVRHQRFVDLVRLEDRRALGGLVLEAHAGADVGVDGVGSGDGLEGSCMSVMLPPVVSAISMALWTISSWARKPLAWRRCSARQAARR